MGLSIGVEAVLWGADLRLWGTAAWRPLAYQYGGFWAGLLYGWRPNFAAQPATMFVTHAFLHAGPVHLAGNMLTLGLVGLPIAARLGGLRFAALYATGMLGGALAFGLLATSPAPMVGASGAIFGLAGVWTVWDWAAGRREGMRSRRLALRALAVILGLALFNLAVWVAQSGQLAWQAHLGGYVAGGLFALHRAGRPVRE